MSNFLLKYLNFLNVEPIEISGVDSIILNTKLKILRGISLVLFFTSATSVTFRILYHHTTFSNVATLASFSIFFLVFHLIFRKTNKVGLSSKIFMVSFFLLATVRVFQGGGVYAPTIYIYIFFCLCAFALYGNFWGKIAITSCAIIVIGVYVSQIHTPTILPTPDTAVIPQGALVLMAYFYNTLPLIYIFNEKNMLAKSLREFEKVQSSNVIMRRISHEIGNALNIVLGQIELAEDNRDEFDIKMTKQKVLEINMLVRVLVNKADKGNLVQFLEEYEKEIKILDQYEK